MAEIYHMVGGKPVEEIVAQHQTVQLDLRREAHARAARSQRLLNTHRDTGASRIVVEHGDIDWYVALDDKNAMQIEFGHGAYLQARDGVDHFVYVGASKGVGALRRGAMG